MIASWKAVLFAGAAFVALAAAPASAQTYTLTASLNGANETPAAINTGAFGSATVIVDMTNRTVTYTVDVFNLPSGVTASHIHAGAAGTAGPIIIDFQPGIIGVSGSFQLSGTTKNFIARPAAGIRSMEEAMMAIAAGNTYVNVHSQTNPGGEIRGQLCPAKSNDNGFNGIVLCNPVSQQ